MKNDYSKIAYNKAEELEQRIVNLTKKIYEVEAMLPDAAAADPNDTPDEPYTPPTAGTIITTSVLTSVPYYHTYNSTFTAYPIFFSSDSNSTLIIKLDINMEILSNPCDMTFRIYLDGVQLDDYIF